MSDTFLFSLVLVWQACLSFVGVCLVLNHNQERHRILVAKISQIPALLAPIKLQLDNHSIDLGNLAVQLDKVKTEILNSIDQELSPEVAAAFEALGAVASTLATKSGAVKTVVDAIDALNEDAPSTEPPAEPPPAEEDPQEEPEPTV